jgi:hypothetical protein
VHACILIPPWHIRYLGGTAPNPPGFHYKQDVKAGKTFEREWPVKKGDKIFWDIEMKGSGSYLDVKAFVGDAMIGEVRIDEDNGVMFTSTHVAEADSIFRIAIYNDGRWSSRTVSYDVRINE